MGQDTTIAHGNQGKLHLGALRRLIVKAIMSEVEENGDFAIHTALFYQNQVRIS